MSGIISPTYTGDIYDPDTTSGTKTTGIETGMGMDAFLTMFLAQVTNQNPLDPMDNTEFTAQLAQFSSLEQLTQINESLESLSSLETVMNRTSALSYLGREVAFEGDVIPVADGRVAEVDFDLEEAAEVRASIYDANGNLVADVDLGELQAGSNTFQWDGTDYNGDAVADGAYTVNLTAYDSSGNSVAISNQQIVAYVTGYQPGEDGNDYLLIGDTALSVDDVLSVRTATDTAQTESQDLSEYLTSLSTGETDTTDLEEGSMTDFLKALATVGSLAATLL